MIRINLLSQKRVRKPASGGQKQIVIGFAALVGVLVVAYAISYRPAQSDLATLEENKGKLEADNGQKRGRLANFQQEKDAVAEIEKRAASIELLANARSAPANFMHELSEILTPGRQPTMDKRTAKLVSEGDPNRSFSLDWDPKHVWIESFEETKGKFKLNGFAQSKPDVTQFEKRLQASLYFYDVERENDERVSAGATGISYYKFSLIGKVVY
ncbi:MAG: PilN domain-containing protein [Myxococcales bacterium]|nr:PilN domain-containing protein [Myxococcales bacterium]